MRQSKGLEKDQSAQIDEKIVAVAPLTLVFTSKTPNPLFGTVEIRNHAIPLLAFAAGQLPLLLTAVAARLYSDWARDALAGMASVLARMVSTAQFASTDLATGKLFRGRRDATLAEVKMRAAEGHCLLLAIAWHRGCDLTGRAWARMTVERARMSTGTGSRARVCAGVRGAKARRPGVWGRSTETPEWRP